jgi:hypothetical protein
VWTPALLVVLLWLISGCTLNANQLAGAALNQQAAPTCYWIESKLTGFVLDINGGNPAQGTPLIVWPKNTPTSANQLWFTNADGTLRSKLNQYVIDIPGADKAQGKQMIVWPLNTPLSPNQQWDLVAQGNGYVVIRSRLQGYLLDVNGGNKAQGTAVIDWPANNPLSDNQLWRLVAAPTADCTVAAPTPVPPAPTPVPPTPTPVPPPAAPIQTDIQIISAPGGLINVQCPGPWNFTFSVLAADPSQGAPTGRLRISCSPLGICPIGFGVGTNAPGPGTISIPSFSESVGETLTLTYYYTPADPTRFTPSSKITTHTVVDEICVQ